MELLDIPVYVFTGFLESGKTFFIKKLLVNPVFATGDKTLLILCENGIEEIDKELLRISNTNLVKVKKEEKLTEELFYRFNEKFQPERVLIEYNCMWNFNKIINLTLPDWWVIAQIGTIIDASTFSIYMNNIRSIMAEQFKKADFVVFNRCDKNTNKLALRGNVKAVNRKAQLIFELENGVIDTSEEKLPFDINASIIEVKEYDFGLWYTDMISAPDKYEDKKIRLVGKVSYLKNCPKDFFVLGRDAMTCCENDITFLGIACRHISEVVIECNEWIEVVGVIKINCIEKYENKFPIIFIESFKRVNKPSEELIYFS